MQYTQSDVTDLAYCGWMEARGDGITACVLVMQVVYNRIAAPGFPKTVHEVIYEPNAFSWTRLDDTEHGTLPKTDDIIYNACLSEAPYMLDGAGSDLTKGAVYYSNEAVVGEGWYRTNIINNPAHPVTLVYKHHTFRK